MKNFYRNFFLKKFPERFIKIFFRIFFLMPEFLQTTKNFRKFFSGPDKKFPLPKRRFSALKPSPRNHLFRSLRPSESGLVQGSVQTIPGNGARRAPGIRSDTPLFSTKLLVDLHEEGVRQIITDLHSTSEKHESTGYTHPKYAGTRGMGDLVPGRESLRRPTGYQTRRMRRVRRTLRRRIPTLRREGDRRKGVIIVFTCCQSPFPERSASQKRPLASSILRRENEENQGICPPFSGISTPDLG